MANEAKIELSSIADRYALALMELGERHESLDTFENDLQTIKSTLDSSKDLEDFLNHPAISVVGKKEVLEKVFKESVSQYMYNFLQVLLDRNRLFVFRTIVEHYRNLLNKKRNIVVAQVITAIDIDEDTRNRVKHKLDSLFCCNIKIESKIDSDILAGMVIKVGDRIIDGSIKTKLDNMKKQII